jgi:hypothetical protein
VHWNWMNIMWLHRMTRIEMKNSMTYWPCFFIFLRGSFSIYQVIKQKYMFQLQFSLIHLLLPFQSFQIDPFLKIFIEFNSITQKYKNIVKIKFILLLNKILDHPHHTTTHTHYKLNRKRTPKNMIWYDETIFHEIKLLVHIIIITTNTSNIKCKNFPIMTTKKNTLDFNE